MPNPNRKQFPPYRRVSKQEQEEMKSLYLGGVSSYQIGARLGRSFKCVLNNLVRMGVPIRSNSEAQKKLSINSDYFREIDTFEKAYLLGFIYADGNVCKNKFSMGLAEQDRAFLEAFAQEVGYDGELYFEPINAANPKRQNMVDLTIYSREFCDHLRSKGVIERKTSTLSFPRWLPAIFHQPFLLGLFDGDGTVGSESGRGNGFTAKCGYAGSPQMMLDVQSHFRDMGINCYYVETGTRGRRVDFRGTQAIKALNYLYQKLPRFYLTRKYARYRQIAQTMQARSQFKSQETQVEVSKALNTILLNAA